MSDGNWTEWALEQQQREVASVELFSVSQQFV